MLYLRNLRVQLQERRNRLYRCGRRTYGPELGYLLGFLTGNRYISCLLSELDASTSVDFSQWTKEVSRYRGIEFPDTEEGRAKVCLGILNNILNDESGTVWLKWARLFSSESNYDAMLRDITESVVDPLVNFLHDRIDDGGNVLYVIERFKMKVEWFRRKYLYSLYSDNTSVGEASLDAELRAALFDGGVDYPFSQPLSPSGQADIVASLNSNDPLVLEVKVFDPNRSKGTSHLKQGFHQITRYSQDYNQSVGYLVIFNCSDKQLVIMPEESSEPEFPPRIHYVGKTFFVVPIDVHPDVVSASRERLANRVEIAATDLIGHIS